MGCKQSGELIMYGESHEWKKEQNDSKSIESLPLSLKCFNFSFSPSIKLSDKLWAASRILES